MPHVKTGVWRRQYALQQSNDALEAYSHFDMDFADSLAVVGASM